MISETRYAIIIGINDYETKPLSFCVNDAVKMKEMLISKCNYKEENVFCIISNDDKSIKDITGRYIEALKSIKEKINTDEDSILFYYAGHGTKDTEKSYLCFRDSLYPIKDIYDDISNLRPKIQFYIIDSCHSGGKVLSRNNEKKEDMVNKYIKNSEGIMFLYACRFEESAIEKKELEHGMLTYYFLEALKNDALYDEEGILTPGRIQEFVSKESVKDSEFGQNPVVENRISGYYPFAFNSSHNRVEKLDKDDISSTSTSKLREDKIIYSQEHRTKVQKIAYDSLNNRFLDLGKKYQDDYDLEEFKELNYSNFKNYESLIDSIVEYAYNNKLMPIGELFIVKQEKNPKYKSISPLVSVLENYGDREPKYIYKYDISFNCLYLNSKFYIFRSLKINKVSFGLGFIVYQSKWGMIATIFTFQLDWDGEEDSYINNIEKEYYPFLLDTNLDNVIQNLDIKIINELEGNINKWNKYREKDMEEFLKRAFR